MTTFFELAPIPNQRNLKRRLLVLECKKLTPTVGKESSTLIQIKIRCFYQNLSYISSNPSKSSLNYRSIDFPWLPPQPTKFHMYTVGEILIPSFTKKLENFPRERVWPIKRHIPSTTIIKRKRDKGSLYLKPLNLGICSVGQPLTSVELLDGSSVFSIKFSYLFYMWKNCYLAVFLMLCNFFKKVLASSNSFLGFAFFFCLQLTLSRYV